MKKILAAVAVLCLASVSFSRILPSTNTLAQSTPDAWSVFGGGCSQNATGSSITGCEVAVDFNGNLLPTVTSAQTLGTSLLQWSSVFTVNETVTGSNSAGTNGTTLASGSGGTAPTASSFFGVFVLPAYQEGTNDGNPGGVLASTSIPVNASHIHVIGNGSVTLTSTPNISTTTVAGGSTSLLAIADGTILIIDSTATVTDAVILQSSGTLTGSGLQLGATTRSIWSQHNIALMYDKATTNWKELWYH